MQSQVIYSQCCLAVTISTKQDRYLDADGEVDYETKSPYSVGGS